MVGWRVGFVKKLCGLQLFSCIASPRTVTFSPECHELSLLCLFIGSLLEAYLLLIERASDGTSLLSSGETKGSLNGTYTILITGNVFIH